MYSDESEASTCLPVLVERSTITVMNIGCIEDVLATATPRRRPITHSAGIKRCYTPPWLQKREVVESDGTVRRRDPFLKRTLPSKSVPASCHWTEWRNPAPVHPSLGRGEESETMMEPPQVTTPRTLRTAHRGISVVRVSSAAGSSRNRCLAMGDDDEHDGASLSPAGRSAFPPTVGAAGGVGTPLAPAAPAPPARSVVRPRGSARAGHNGAAAVHVAAPPAAPREAVRSPPVAPLQSPTTMRSFHRSGARIDPRTNEIAAFNALKKRAMQLMAEDVQTSTTTLTPEMFVRAEDDFLRFTKGRKNRTLYLRDVQEDLRLIGCVVSTKRLETLLSGNRNMGRGISFLELLHHTFPAVSTAVTDALALKYSTSLNPLLGGSVEQRTCPEVFQMIRSLYQQFDLDGDGVVHRSDIVELRQRHQKDRRGGGGGALVAEDMESDAALLDRSCHNSSSFPNEIVTLSDFAHFVRFLFPPYKAVS